MLLIQKNLNRLVVILLLVFGLTLSQVSQVKAGCDPLDNDCSTVKACQLTVGDALVGTNDAAKKDIHFTRKEGDKYVYKVVACGLDPIVSSCSSNQKVVLAYQYGLLPFWYYMDLAKNGSCYEGELKISAAYAMGAQFDIEINEGGGGSCASKLPLCRRAFGTIYNTSAADLQKCSAAAAAMTSCSAVSFQTKKLVKGQPINFSVNIDPILGTDSCDKKSEWAEVDLVDPNQKSVISENYAKGSYGLKNYSFTPEMVASCTAGGYKLTVATYTRDGRGKKIITTCPLSFGVGATDTDACAAPEPAASAVEHYKICDQINKSTRQYEMCIKCVGGEPAADAPSTPEGIWTAVGCIKSDPKSIIVTVIKIGLGIAGGGALLMILAASFIISTSAGDAKKFTEAKEMISNAVIGLIFIIMSITILQFIGVTLFHIPGFGEG